MIKYEAMPNSMHAPEAAPKVAVAVADEGPKPPMDLSHHYSRVTKSREESRMKEFYKYFMIPGIANLAGGKSSRFRAHCVLALCIVA
jgi:hypothetical protein